MLLCSIAEYFCELCKQRVQILRYYITKPPIRYIKKKLLTFKPACVFGVSNGLEVVRSKRQAKHESANTGQAKLVGIEPSLCFKDIRDFKEARKGFSLLYCL